MNNKNTTQNIISSSINDRGAYSSFAEVLEVSNTYCKVTFQDRKNKKIIVKDVEIRPIYMGTTLWTPNVGDIVIIQEMDSHVTITQPLTVRTSKKKLSSQSTLKNAMGGVLF